MIQSALPPQSRILMTATGQDDKSAFLHIHWRLTQRTFFCSREVKPELAGLLLSLGSLMTNLEMVDRTICKKRVRRRLLAVNGPLRKVHYSWPKKVQKKASFQYTSPCTFDSNHTSYTQILGSKDNRQSYTYVLNMFPGSKKFVGS
jgi:hypothetical protein